jgi:ribose/xylose/arabinose/galactoside ABC-type transport system permease subunit
MKALARKSFVEYGVLPLFLIALFIIFGLSTSRFWSGDNIFNISQQVTYLAVATMGQMMYLLSRSYDLSNGSCIALTSIVTCMVMTSDAWGDNVGLAIAAGCAAGIGAGVVVGLINGVVTSVFKISSFIVTLATSSIAFGVALKLTGGLPVTGLPDEFVSGLGTGKVWIFAVPLIVTVVIGVLFYGLLNWTRFGRHTYAIGGNEEAARAAGVPVVRTRIMVAVTGSTLAAVAGIMLTARISSGEPNLGAQYPLQTIAAAVLGGVSLFGGEGRLLGAVIGALFITVLGVGMDLVNIESFDQQIVFGVLLIMALVVDRARARMQG